MFQLLSLNVVVYVSLSYQSYLLTTTALLPKNTLTFIFSHFDARAGVSMPILTDWMQVTSNDTSSGKGKVVPFSDKKTTKTIPYE